MDTSIDTPEDDNDLERILAESILEGQLAATLAAKEHRSRLLNDFPYFCEHALKIRAESGELVPLILNRTQRHILVKIAKQWLETGRIRVVICKARQQKIWLLTVYPHLILMLLYQYRYYLRQPGFLIIK